MTIITGQLLLCDQPPTARIEPGWLRIRDGHIDEVVTGEIAKNTDLGSANALISPGFVDTHLHLPQFDMIGAHGLPLLDWLENVTFPSEQKWEDESYAQNMTERVLNQCLSVGTTAVCAYATVHHAAAIAAIETAKKINMRGVIGQVLMDRNAPDYLCRDPKKQIDEAKSTLVAFPPNERLSAAVTPRFAISCTPDLLRDAGVLAVEHDAVVQTHLAETARECDFVRELFDGVNYVNVYKNANLVGPRVVFGHGIHLDQADRRLLSESSAIIAHCPTANSFLRSGTMNRQQLLDDSVRVSLGSDIGAGYERSMVRVGRAMIESASGLGENYPSPAEAWYQITAGNADTMQWADAGRIEKGNPADILIVEPSVPWLDSSIDPLAMLMFCWDDRWLTHTLLMGQPSYSC